MYSLTHINTYTYLYSSYPNFKVVAWLTSKVAALLAFKYPAVDLAAWRKANEGASSNTHEALSRDEQIKAIQDADRARGDKVTAPLAPPRPSPPAMDAGTRGLGLTAWGPEGWRAYNSSPLAPLGESMHACHMRRRMHAARFAARRACVESTTTPNASNTPPIPY
jgi:hypothetical protein